MRTQTRLVSTSTVTTNGIITALSSGATGALTLDGSFVTGGIATLPQNGRISINSNGNDSGTSFVIVGTITVGIPASTTSQYPYQIVLPATETLAGPNDTTVNSVLDYTTVTSITVTAAQATQGTIIVGNASNASSAMVPLDYYGNASPVSLQCIVTSGSPTYQVEFTNDDVNSPTVTPPYNWFTSNDANVVGATTSQESNFIVIPTGTRLTITGGTGAVTYYVKQAEILGV